MAYKKATYVLLDLNFSTTTTPIEPILEENNINLCKFSEIKNFINRDTPIYKSSGFLANRNGHYIIIYNDSDDFFRIRWTIAHELGHYYLNHNFENQNEYDAQEIEANYFASQLLMPIELLLLLDQYYYLEELVLEKYCRVSHEAAKNRLNYYFRRKYTFANLKLSTDMMYSYCQRIKNTPFPELYKLKRP